MKPKNRLDSLSFGPKTAKTAMVLPNHGTESPASVGELIRYGAHELFLTLRTILLGGSGPGDAKLGVGLGQR